MRGRRRRLEQAVPGKYAPGVGLSEIRAFGYEFPAELRFVGCVLMTLSRNHTVKVIGLAFDADSRPRDEYFEIIAVHAGRIPEFVDRAFDIDATADRGKRIIVVSAEIITAKHCTAVS